MGKQMCHCEMEAGECATEHLLEVTSYELKQACKSARKMAKVMGRS